MKELRRQVRRAQWQLAAGLFLQSLAWTLFAAMMAAAVLVGLERFGVVRLGVPWEAWPAGAAGLALLAAGIWTLLRRASPLHAALEIDRRFGLRERVSSSLALPPEEMASPVGQALLADAARRVQKLYVPEKFPIRVGPWACLPLVPLLFLGLVVLFVHPAAAVNSATNQAALAKKAKPKKQVKKQLSAKKKRLQECR